MKKLLLTIAAAAIVLWASAQSGAVFGWGRTLEPMEKCAVSLRALDISMKDTGRRIELDIRYTLHNPGPATTLKLVFESEVGGGAIEPQATPENDNMKGFAVSSNGAAVNYSVVIVPGKDYYSGGKLKTIPFSKFKEAVKNFDWMEGIDMMYLYCTDVPLASGDNTITHRYSLPWSYFDDPKAMFYILPSGMSNWANGKIDEYTVRIASPYFILNGPLRKFFTVEGSGRKTMSSIVDYSEDEMKEVAVPMFFLRDGHAVLSRQNVAQKDAPVEVARYMQRIDEEFDFQDDEIVIQPTIYAAWYDELGPDARKVLRNLPFAMHGYVFKDPALKKFYSRMWWYMPDPEYKAVVSELSKDEQEWIMELTGQAEKR